MIDPFDAAGTLRPAYRRVDWATTPLGPVSSWSPALAGAVDVMLNTRSAVTLFWGPELVLVYNEAYADMIGDKHPAALGAPAAAVFAEIWDTIGPMLTSVLAGAGATWVEDLKLLMNRRGFLEETYFTFSYSAVRGPGGAIEGVIDIASETTAQVVRRRRLELLSTLNDRLADVEDLAQLLERARPVLRSDPDDLPGAEILVGDAPSFAAERVRIPLSGPVHLTTGLSPHLPADEDYLGFLRLVGGALTQGLHRIGIRQAERRSAATEREMAEALQRSLLTAPAQPDHLEVAVRYHPSAEGAQVGGDWYDAFEVPGGRLAVAVGDVTGHDRHAAAAMSQIRNLLRGISYALPKPPGRVLSALNDAMTGLNVDVFATVVLAQIDLATHELRWSNAGHPPPLLLRPDGTVHVLEARAEVMLGLRHPPRRSNHTVPLEPGAAVVLYTDGLVERRGDPLDVGIKHLGEALRGCSGLTAEQLSDRLLDRLAAGAEDDVVLAVVRRRPAGK